LLNVALNSVAEWEVCEHVLRLVSYLFGYSYGFVDELLWVDVGTTASVTTAALWAVANRATIATESAAIATSTAAAAIARTRKRIA
jgi:hypothetical protein